MEQFIDNELYHYGTKRHSGRYPWGSGEDPFQHDSYFLEQYNSLKEQGLSETEIAKGLGMSTTELRKRKSLEKAELKAAEYSYAIKLKDKGYSNVAIAEKLGKNESYVRTLLDPVLKERAEKTSNVADALREVVDEYGYVDVGPGTGLYINASQTRVNTALKKLEDEGYTIKEIYVPQAGNPGKNTTIKVLAKPGSDAKDIWAHQKDIVVPGLKKYSEDDWKTSLGIEKPQSIDSSRILIRYAEDGGTAKDGVIEIRPGVEDLSLGNSRYAQARIAVNDTHYLKGMAIYSNDIPKGYDIIFNTNKHVGTPMCGTKKGGTVLKEMKSNPDNPFGTTLKMEDGVIVGQHHYIGKDGKEHLSAINIVREEGDWDTWSKTLSSQFLSKQDTQLIKQQLDLTYERHRSEYENIAKLTNPEIKIKLLDDFASECDSAAVHLKAAALPRQSSKVILPLTKIKDNEIYAPTYKNGEQVILIRYPHGGTFEIPTLTVNNKNPQGKEVLGQATDAVGISAAVAERLSGADFDGDTVTVIPMKGQKLTSTSPLKGLENFDPKERYPEVPGMIYMTKANTQAEMGKVSNLITDMTLQGAKEEELARAVRHSMVVIDAEKHKLNYKQSEIDNNIAGLKEKYQGGARRGASTLISKASSDARVPVRKEITNPSSMTPEELKIYNAGGKVYRETGESYKKYSIITDTSKMTSEELEIYNAGGKVYRTDGKEHLRLEKTTKMAVADNALELVANTSNKKEMAYANYANKMKALGNEARKESRNTNATIYSPQAKETYKTEVDSLNKKLEIAISNKPLERQAQVMANAIVKDLLASNPEMTPDEIKKATSQALSGARTRMGASKSTTQVEITPKEWEAIQAGAISSSKLKQILANCDIDQVKQYALPHDDQKLTPAQKARLNTLAKNGYTQAEIAEALGISASTVNRLLSPNSAEHSDLGLSDIDKIILTLNYGRKEEEI